VPRRVEDTKNLVMASVADQNDGTAACGRATTDAKALLVIPGKIPFVVANESVVVVRNRVRGVAIDQIPFAGSR